MRVGLAESGRIDSGACVGGKVKEGRSGEWSGSVTLADACGNMGHPCTRYLGSSTTEAAGEEDSVASRFKDFCFGESGGRTHQAGEAKHDADDVWTIRMEEAATA